MPHTIKIPSKKQLRERFANELGIEHLSESEQDEIISKLSMIIMERITLEMMNLLPDDVFKQIDELVAKNKINDINNIIVEHVPNAHKIIEQITIRTIIEFKMRSKNTKEHE